MKKIKYALLFALAAFGLSACSENDETGAGDATVGFEQTSYTFKENEGTVRIPLKFSGEPKKYPIVLNVSASVDGDVALGDVVRFVQQIGSLRYNGSGELAIEIELLDNFEQNPARNLTLEIVSADGATIVEGRTTIVIADNDSSPFESLQGEWRFKAMRNRTEPVIFNVVIDAGETDKEVAENTEKQRLRVVGFGGYGYSEDEYEIPFAWYLDIVTDETTGVKSLKTVPGIPMINHPGDVFGEGLSSTRVFLYAETVEDEGNIQPNLAIPATWSDDMRTITFDTGYIMVPYIFDGSEPYNEWAILYDCTMTRL